MPIVGFDSSTLLNYYAARQSVPTATQSVATSQNQTALAPWDLRIAKPKQEIEDVTARSSDPYFDPKDTTLLAKSGSSSTSAGSQLEALLQSTLSKNTASQNSSANAADNDRLFALYNALNRLQYIAQMAKRDTTQPGQLAGLDASFQAGLKQVMSFVDKASFDNLTMLQGVKAASVQSAVTIPYAPYNYTGGNVAIDTKVLDPLANVSTSDSFTVSVTKGGVKTDVAIDLANVSGPLTLDNINAYVNQQLAANGFSTKFGRVQTGGDLAKGTVTWAAQIAPGSGETVALSSTQASPAVYVAATTGKPDNSAGKLIKVSDVDGAPDSQFSKNITPDSGTANAKASAIDANGNVYVIGNTTGSFGAELNQGSQDVYLTKYDSAGNVQWTKLLGAAQSASGYGIATDPVSGGVVIAGAVTGDLSTTSIGGGSSDSFVAKYDKDGNQTWVRQVAPMSADQANGVSVDSSGNIFVAGQVSGTIASGQTNAGGQDAYVTKLDSKGALAFTRQFGTAGTDAAVKTAVASDGNLVVASVQNGHAILTKYGSADGTSAAIWQQDLGDLQGGSIGGLAISNDQIYLSGTTNNASLTAGGAATIASANSGGTDAFVFNATDSGGTVAANHVSYVGTSSSEQGGGVTVAGGKVYLTGTTTGTFAGETRNVADTHNLFVAQLAADGTFNWAKQYGGTDGQSQGVSVVADNSGSSVLDALGLPRGTLSLTQSSAITSQTTVRVGDTFSLQIQGKTGTRNATITISKGETLRTLALKINGALLFDGKATALPAKGGQGLKIQVNDGVQVQLVAGSKDFDALAGLGLKPQLLTGAPLQNSPNSTTTASSNSTKQVVGLGIDGGVNLLTVANASHANVVMTAAQALIKQAYNTLNAPASSAATQAASGPAPAYLQSQIASYQTALAAFSS